jgi:adenylate cyclase
MESRDPVRTVTIRRSLIRNLILLILLLTGSILLTTIYTGQRITELTSRALIDRALDRTESDVRRFFDPVERSLLVARRLIRSGALELDDPQTLNRHFIPVVEGIPQVSSVNLGDAEGAGYLLLRFPDRWRNRLVRADAWGDRLEFAEWSDEQTRLREWSVEQPGEEERYDPRTRAWYRVANEAAARLEPGVELPREVYWTEAYPFFTTGEPGITAMVHVEDAAGRRSILAFDVLLRDLSDFTRRLAVSANGFGVVLEVGGRVLGLPGLPRFDDPAARAEAYLKRPHELEVPALADGARAAAALGPDPPATFQFESGGETYWADSRPLPLGANHRVEIVVAVPERDLVGVINQQRLLLLGVSLLGFGVAVGMAVYLARRYSRPLAALADNSERIGALDLQEIERVHSSIREVEQLASEQERMRVALDSFARYVPVDVIRELMVRGEAARIGGARRTITVLFTDIAGFTSVAESVAPEVLTAHMAEYFEEMMGIVQGDGFGEVTQITGDGLVAFWGAPIPDADHAVHAAAAVLRCQERLVELNERWPRRDMPALPTRFGLASGPVVVGNVGALSRLVYTALGDTINLASRLEGLNRFYGTGVLVSAALRDAAADAFAWRRVDVVRVKGKAKAVEIYELLGTAGRVSGQRMAFAARYEQALAAYRERRFADAVACLETLAAEQAGDLSVERLLGLARRFVQQPPDEGWDGVTDYFQK